MSATAFRFADVDGSRVFYREAGPADGPAVLLLHGFPTSSHMFRDLIPHLSGPYRVIAPDLPGFGVTVPAAGYAYSFANLAATVGRFTEVVGLSRYALYVFDYGAPVGFRLAVAHPERVTAIVSQNGNAYAEGLSDGWNPIRAYWHDPSPANRDALRGMLTPEAVEMQYRHGVPDPSAVAPEGYTLDAALLARPGNADVQLDLLRDYATNVDLYPAFQQYLRDHRPPVLAAWGKNDPFFLPAGAEAFRRDVPAADVRFYDTGHFALETHAAEIGQAITEFLARSAGHSAGPRPPLKEIHMQPPIDTVSKLYAALAAGDVPTVLGLMADDIEWVTMPTWPYHADGRGPRAVADGVLGPMMADWADLRLDVADRLATDGDRVVTLGHYRGVHRRTGRRVDAEFAHVWTVRDGRISRFRSIMDSLGMDRARTGAE